MAKRFFLKSLDRGFVSAHGFLDRCGQDTWSVPSGTQPGAWKPEIDTSMRPLRPHYWGYHLAKLEHVGSWFYRENFLAQADGEIVEDWDCAVATRARLVKHLPVSEPQWAQLALEAAKDIHTLPCAMGFPQDLSHIVHDAYIHARVWLDGGDNHHKAADLCRRAFLVAGRNLIDAGRCVQYTANSQAMAHAALSVASLIHLRREDGVQLKDYGQHIAYYTSGNLRKLWSQGVAMQTDIDCNADIARQSCGHAAQAAEAALRQIEFMRSCAHAHEVDRLERNLLPLSDHWRKTSNLPANAPSSHHALAGLRMKQSARVRRVLGI